MLKMRAVITLLVLLLSMCVSQTRSTQTEVHTESQSTGAAAAAADVSTQLDVSAELRELRDMVIKQGMTLSFTQDELKNTKDLLNKMLIVNYTLPNDYKIYLEWILHVFFPLHVKQYDYTSSLNKEHKWCAVHML